MVDARPDVPGPARGRSSEADLDRVRNEWDTDEHPAVTLPDDEPLPVDDPLSRESGSSESRSPESRSPESRSPESRSPESVRRRRRRLRKAAIVAAISVVALAAGVYWLQGKLDPPGPRGAAVRIEVAAGASAGTIADQLAHAGVVTNATIFRLYLRVRGAGGFKAGSYELRLRSSMGDVLDAFSAGPSLPPATNLTIPEGLTLTQVAARVAKVATLQSSTFLDAARDGSIRSAYEPAGSNNLEGLLFPDTYRIGQSEDERAVVKQMVTTFDRVGTELGLGNAQQLVGFTPYQVVIVASLVEAEAKSDADRPKIARVIYNRLAAHMPLGIDSAFYYALPPDRRGTSLRQSDLTNDGPYNTRTRTGLVPTPIMAPGRASLAAALVPAQGTWLYYVLQDSTTHVFSTTYDQFLKDKAAAEKVGLIP